MNIFARIMPWRHWIVFTTIIAAIGATMTMPGPELQSLPGQISQQGESPMVARIGVVTDIVEADNITVKISGSDVLVRASYLFPAYQPLLGDLVYVAKQDAQWLVLGTTSGPPNSLLENSSFELGTVGALPTSWTITAVSSVAGVIGFTKQPLSSIQGGFIGIIRNSSAGVAGTSSANIFSSAPLASPNQRWAVGYFIPYAVPDVNAALVPQGGFMDLQAFIQFLDSTGALISETSANYTPIYAAFSSPVYARTATPTNASYVLAPAGTQRARLRLRVNMTMHVNSASEIGLDLMLMRFA